MTEVFTIATRLTRVTGAMRKRDMDSALEKTVPDWRGGTRLGEALTVYLRRFGHRGMARGAIVVICSDGWECGDATELAELIVMPSAVAVFQGDAIPWSDKGRKALTAVRCPDFGARCQAARGEWERAATLQPGKRHRPSWTW